ncbi:hypothetical protein NB311A_08583 [Nitrobacter sp. Nb-311A]|nr:hypothetical protein NB311A_08583 [Nitrobacter sp. Nb-311A]
MDAGFASGAAARMKFGRKNLPSRTNHTYLERLFLNVCPLDGQLHPEFA